MNCRDAARRLPGYIDGAIPAQDHAIVREHLNVCGSCRDLLESYRRLSVCLANVDPVTYFLEQAHTRTFVASVKFSF